MVKIFNFFKGVIYDDTIVWRTAKGRHTPIAWMTTLHIQNVLSCLRNDGELEIPNPYFGKSHREWINIFELELQNRR